MRLSKGGHGKGSVRGKKTHPELGILDISQVIECPRMLDLSVNGFGVTLRRSVNGQVRGHGLSLLLVATNVDQSCDGKKNVIQDVKAKVRGEAFPVARCVRSLEDLWEGWVQMSASY